MVVSSCGQREYGGFLARLQGSSAQYSVFSIWWLAQIFSRLKIVTVGDKVKTDKSTVLGPKSLAFLARCAIFIRMDWVSSSIGRATAF